MGKRKTRKKIQLTDFGNILFTSLARSLLHNEEQENLVLSKSILNVLRAVELLSYVYRPVFREKFQDAWRFLSRDLEKNPALFAYTFSDSFSENYTAFKFLVWCSFISELHLFLCDGQTANKEEYYVKQCNIVFKDIFDIAFDDEFYKAPQKWIHVFWWAGKIAKKFPLIKPFMNDVSNETGKLAASFPDTTTDATGRNGNRDLLAAIDTPRSSQSKDGGNLPKHIFHNLDGEESGSILPNIFPVTESVSYSPTENETNQVRCLFLDRLMKKCSLNGDRKSDMYYDTDDNSPPIKSPNVPPSKSGRCSGSEIVISRKRTASTSKGNASKRFKK